MRVEWEELCRTSRYERALLLTQMDVSIHTYLSVPAKSRVDKREAVDENGGHAARVRHLTSTYVRIRALIYISGLILLCRSVHSAGIEKHRSVMSR